MSIDSTGKTEVETVGAPTELDREDSCRSPSGEAPKTTTAPRFFGTFKNLFKDTVTMEFTAKDYEIMRRLKECYAIICTKETAEEQLAIAYETMDERLCERLLGRDGRVIIAFVKEDAEYQHIFEFVYVLAITEAERLKWRWRGLTDPWYVAQTTNKPPVGYIERAILLILLLWRSRQRRLFTTQARL